MFGIIDHLLTLVRNEDDSSFLVGKVHSQVLGLGLLMTGLLSTRAISEERLLIWVLFINTC